MFMWGVKKPHLSSMGMLDANEAVASVAYRLNEFFAIYPITPSSPMAEFADEWSSGGKTNLWGAVPSVVEMQLEGGAAGALHGALQAGSLLMIPNMYKIAGELIPFCLHVTARALATHALSIFGDHSDVMVCRQTGFGMLCGGSVQEAQDTAVISQMVTLRSRVPFLHFFDGFRTSHEVSKISLISDEDLRALIDEDSIQANRKRALTPDHPVIRGTAQNPDAFFQAREAGNPYYIELPRLVKEAMAAFGEQTGRVYQPFDYEGHPEAERVTALMLGGKGDLLPVSAFPVDGVWPITTTQWEKRNIAEEIPVWEMDLCIQCNKCAIVCPHAAIRPKVFTPDHLAGAPDTFKSTEFKVREYPGMLYALQVAPEDCTGCQLCVQVCPAKDKSNPSRKAINMSPQLPLCETERKNFAFFLDLRWKPTHHALHHQWPRPRPGLGELALRRQRGIRPRDARQPRPIPRLRRGSAARPGRSDRR